MPDGARAGLGAGGAGLTVGTTYYVLSAGLTTTAFRVAATPGGSAIAFTSDIERGTVRVAGVCRRAIRVGTAV